MAKEQINQYIKEIKETSFLEDIDENNNSFKRVCIFFNDDNGNLIEMHLRALIHNRILENLRTLHESQKNFQYLCYTVCEQYILFGQCCPS